MPETLPLENLSDHSTSNALISSAGELEAQDNLEDNFLAVSLVGVVFFLVTFSALVSTCPRVWTKPRSTRDWDGLATFFSFLVLYVGGTTWDFCSLVRELQNWQSALERKDQYPNLCPHTARTCCAGQTQSWRADKYHVSVLTGPWCTQKHLV